MPKCDSLPSQDFIPCSISRKLCARPSWQNSIDTNCCQQLTPRACRSALSLRTCPSKSLREMNLRIWLNRLQNGLTLSSPCDGSERFVDLPRFGGRVVESIYSGVLMLLLRLALG